jgi:hypothetical protein
VEADLEQLKNAPPPAATTSEDSPSLGISPSD